MENVTDYEKAFWTFQACAIGLFLVMTALATIGTVIYAKWEDR